MSWFPILLTIHICLAVALLAPSVILPFVLRRSSGQQPGLMARALMVMQGTGTLVIGLGLALTGAGMLWILGPRLLTQPWLMVALAIYGTNLLIAAFISRPNLRRLVRLGSDVDDETWRRRARRQRYVAYGMAAMIGAIGLLMSAKPTLW